MNLGKNISSLRRKSGWKKSELDKPEKTGSWKKSDQR